MATEFLMPKLGLTMEAGTIIDWLVAPGAEVGEGTAVLNIETDKVESEVEASAAGRLHIVGEKGDTYACGELIGWFLEPGETPPEAPTPLAASPASSAVAARGADVVTERSPPQLDGRILASPNARRVAAERGVDLAQVTGTGPGGRIVSEDVGATPAREGQAASVHASVAAHQLADLLGLDLAILRAHGPDTRINREDVARYAREHLAGSAEPAPDRPEPSLLQTPTDTIAMTGMRGTIAKRTHSALQDMAQLTLTMDVVMDAVVADRADPKHDVKPGYTDYVIAAVAAALATHPVVNSQIHEGGLALLPEINVGLAVALDEGLVVPVIAVADTKTLEEISAETSRLAAAARERTLSFTDLEGGTFSVTALGMFGVDAFTPVINPPNTAILGVGRLRDGIDWSDGTPQKTTVLTLSLTWDHRAFDGAPAAQFTASVRDRLEDWGRPT